MTDIRNISSGASHLDNIAAARAELGPTAPLFVLYVGAENPATGKSWCGDCVTMKPVALRALAGLGSGVTVLVASVTRKEWKDKENPHPLRKNRWANVTGVPALVKIGQKVPVGVLVEDQIMDKVLLDALLKA